MTKRTSKQQPEPQTAAPAEDLTGPEDAAPAPPSDPVLSAATFLDTDKLKRVHADLIRSLCATEKHTLTGWRERLKSILTARTGGPQ